MGSANKLIISHHLLLLIAILLLLYTFILKFLLQIFKTTYTLFVICIYIINYVRTLYIHIQYIYSNIDKVYVLLIAYTYTFILCLHIWMCNLCPKNNRNGLRKTKQKNLFVQKWNTDRFACSTSASNVFVPPCLECYWVGRDDRWLFNVITEWCLQKLLYKISTRIERVNVINCELWQI